MRQLIAALPFLLAACGGGGSGGEAAPPATSDDATEGFAPAGDVVNACASPYHQEVVGEYSGQLEFVADRPGDDEISCAWETTLSVLSGYTTDTRFRRFCDLTAAMTAEPLPNSSPACRGLDVRGEMLDALKASTPDTWFAPLWPVDATLMLAADVPGGESVYPVGVDGIPTRQVTWVFDGSGNVTLSRAREELEWSGLLVKE